MRKIVAGKELTVGGRFLKIGSIAEGYDMLDDPIEEWIDAFRHEASMDLFTFIPPLSAAAPRYPYHQEADNFAVCSISTYDRWLMSIDKKARNMVRKAEKCGLEAREVPFDDILVAGIASINDETPMRQGRRFSHYRESLETVRALNGTFRDRAIFIGVFDRTRLIGYVKLVPDEDGEQAGIMQILSLIAERGKAPNNLLIAQAVRSCAERGIGYLWYANFDYGTRASDGLRSFKEENGFERRDVVRYYIPLTWKGRLALSMGLHRPVWHRLPPGLVDQAARIKRLLAKLYRRQAPRLDP